MNLALVAYRVAHGYPGGIPALAAAMAVSKNVLQNKVNPRNDTHHLTLEEAATIGDIADSDEIAHAFAARRNLVCIPLPDYDGLSDLEMLDLHLSLQKEAGEWAVAIQKALADGMVDAGEFARIEREFRDYQAAAAELMSRLKSIVQERRAQPRQPSR